MLQILQSLVNGLVYQLAISTSEIQSGTKIYLISGDKDLTFLTEKIFAFLVHVLVAEIRRRNFIDLMLKGSDWLCKVLELSMHCCGKLLSDSFKTY